MGHNEIPRYTRNIWKYCNIKEEIYILMYIIDEIIALQFLVKNVNPYKFLDIIGKM